MRHGTRLIATRLGHPSSKPPKTPKRDSRRSEHFGRSTKKCITPSKLARKLTLVPKK